MPRYNIHIPGPASPYAKNRYRAVHAAMPMSSMRFTPSRMRNHGMSSMNAISDICPSDIFAAAPVTPISFMNGFVKA